MKQIKYGNKTKSKPNNFVDDIREGEDDICGNVLDTLNADYLAYISDLVRATKTPTKKRNKTSQKVNSLFESPKNINNYTFHEKQQKKNDEFIAEVSPTTEKSYKNSTVPFKNLQQKYQNQDKNMHNQDKQHRQRSKTREPFQNLRKNQGMIEHYNRFPTQEAQLPAFRHRNKDQTSIVYSNEGDKEIEHDFEENFLNGIDQYLLNLESSRNIGGKSRKIKKSQNIRDIEQVMQQNMKLRKKVHKYEQKIEDIQENLENHFIQCNKKQKQQKKKINDLIKSLAQAVHKINEQKQQIDTMKSLFKMIGRKAQYCAINEDQDQIQEIEEEINETLIKAMRPSRAQSENKLKKKRDINELFKQRDR